MSVARVVLITGAGGGLGLAVAETFLNAGFRAALTYTSDRGRTRVEQKFGGRGNWIAVQADVLDEAAVQNLIEQVKAELGRIDVLVNLVGGFIGGLTVAETEESQWQRMMDLNLKSVFLCSKHVLPVMKAQHWGRIVNIGARGALHGGAGLAAYAASKAAVLNLTESLAEEGRAFNITANAVLPSIIDTEANRRAMPDANHDQWVKPDVIAKTILFLSSDDAGDLSGARIPVFGKA